MPVCRVGGKLRLTRLSQFLTHAIELEGPQGTVFRSPGAASIRS